MGGATWPGRIKEQSLTKQQKICLRSKHYFLIKPPIGGFYSPKGASICFRFVKPKALKGAKPSTKIYFKMNNMFLEGNILRSVQFQSLCELLHQRCKKSNSFQVVPRRGTKSNFFSSGRSPRPGDRFATKKVYPRGKDKRRQKKFDNQNFHLFRKNKSNDFFRPKGTHPPSE
eukprot:TRINITY_DN2997_c0_g2_i10.p1 TRINITY_DN2997_c0_g2~~TRINITY_DN2997_c0_g2_i10.p1  ORF type:complete len:172 (+),score=16.05 TRINITY_DN2997_c0_g2_i10:196-711(+)